jgi:ketosteroid isomerase-like protein
LSDISTPADPREIASLIRGIYEAFAVGNVTAIESALADDCTVWDVFTPQLIKGREERDRFHEADQNQKSSRGALTWRLDEPLIDVWGDTALARYVLEFAYAPPRAVEGTIRITDVLRKRDGRWRIVHHHEGTMPAGVP